MSTGELIEAVMQPQRLGLAGQVRGRLSRAPNRQAILAGLGTEALKGDRVSTAG